MTSSFPKLWNIARISPIPKVNEPRCDADHRPVSILPTLSKVFERLVPHQLIEYINKEALLSPTISGFRMGHSTTSVLLGIRDAPDTSVKQKGGDINGLCRLQQSIRHSPIQVCPHQDA